MSEHGTGQVRGQATRVIDGRKYTTTPLPARQGLGLLRRLIACAGQEVVTMFFSLQGQKDAEKKAEAKREVLSHPALKAQIMTRIAEHEDADQVIYELLEKTECDRIRLGSAEVEGSVHTHFDEHFKADYAHLLDVALFVGEVNFGGP